MNFPKACLNFYANALDAFVPEQWANETLMILEENMVLGNLVHRDFSSEIAKFGKTVHTRKPGAFTAKRKVANDNVTIQDATSVDIPVVLNQHFHTSFMIADGEESTSFQDLTNTYMRPAALSLAQAIDRVLSGQAIRFRPYVAGTLNGMTADNASDYILDARLRMNINKAGTTNRNLILTPIAESIMLKNDKFTNADKVGDNGTALREASLGRKFGYNLFMAQNQPYVAAGNTVVTGAINNASGYGARTTSFTVDGLAAAVSAGTWFTIAGDMTPMQVVSTTGGSTPTAIVAYRGSNEAVVDNAVITLYTPGAVNNASGYAAGWAKEIVVDGFTVAPQIGQPITFAGDNANVYTIIDVNGVIGVTLDRPLVAAIADNDKASVGPAGSYNFAFTRNAIAMVSRPLALPRQGTGALAANIDYNNLSMRVVMTYQGKEQGTLVTCDMLMGVAILEILEGALLLS